MHSISAPATSNAVKAALLRCREAAQSYRLDVAAIAIGAERPASGFLTDAMKDLDRWFARGRFGENFWYSEFSDLLPSNFTAHA
jgi:hypothetical protein